MSTLDEDTDDILKLDPLTCFFLSGFATQLFLMICYTNKTVIDIQANKLMYNSEIRIQRWSNLFFIDCLRYFQVHSFRFESNLATITNPQLDPLSMHCHLLITVSKKLGQLKENGQLGPHTLLKVSEWFDIIKEVLMLPLGLAFSPDLKQELMESLKNYNNVESQNNSSTMKEYPHFSPGALFIRFSCVVYLHYSRMCAEKFANWQHKNSTTVTKIFKIEDFLKENDSIKSLKCFVTKFPYIHHLPCKNLYEEMDQDVHVTNIFVRLLEIIYLYMKHYHFHQDYNEQQTDEKNLNTFKNFKDDSKNKMLTESKRVKNCEKQRVHHQKQIVFPTKKRKKTNEIDINQNEWSLRFLFGKHCDILFPNKTLFSIEETFAY
jgi:hypothetical protein